MLFIKYNMLCEIKNLVKLKMVLFRGVTTRFDFYDKLKKTN